MNLTSVEIGIPIFIEEHTICLKDKVNISRIVNYVAIIMNDLINSAFNSIMGDSFELEVSS